MEKENKRKGIIYLVIAVVTLLVLIAGATYAYFQAVTGNGANIDINATSSTVDNLTFNKGNDITIKATQQNFTETSGNQTGSTNVSATLVANNNTNKATEHYNVYLEITANDFEYSSYTDPEKKVPDLVFTNEYDKTLGNNRDYNGLTKGYDPIPELFLTISGPEEFNKEIPDLTRATLTTDNDSYDITELREGIYPIAEDFPINVTADDEGYKKTDEWNITVTFKNLKTDQELNTKKTFNARIIIQAEKIANDLMDVCSEGSLLAECIKELHDQSVYGASNLIYHDGQNDTTRGEIAGTLEAGDNSYRYTGSYEKVNNYICFGSSCSTDASDPDYNNLYRIIGTFGDDGIKLVKADFANKELLGSGTLSPENLELVNPLTHGSYAKVISKENLESNEEQDGFTHRYKGLLDHIDLYRWQENGIQDTVAEWSTSLLNKIHLNTVYYGKLESNNTRLANLILNHTWKYNTLTYTYMIGNNIKLIYDYEIGINSTANQKTDPENIGLLYASDYLYSASQNNWNKKAFNSWEYNDCGFKDKFNNPAGCFPIKLIEEDYRSTTDNNWLYLGYMTWLQTSRYDSSSFAMGICSTGLVSSYFSGTWFLGVRPTFYITNETKIGGGTGTIDNPYTITFE